MPTDKEIGQMYSEYYSRSDGIGYAEYSKEIEPERMNYLILKTLQEYLGKREIEVLDVGCAYGALVAFLRKWGIKASGVDFSQEAVAYGKKTWNLDLTAAPLEEFRPQKKYDAITMVSFVEHLAKPDTWVNVAGNLIKDKGILVIMTPDFDCYDIYGTNWIGYNLSYEHILFFNGKSLERCLVSAGFEIIKTCNLKILDPVKNMDRSFRFDDDVVYPMFRLLRKFNFLPYQITRMSEWFFNGITFRKIIGENRKDHSILLVARKIWCDQSISA